MNRLKLTVGLRRATASDLFDESGKLYQGLTVILGLHGSFNEVYSIRGDELIPKKSPQFQGEKIWLLTADPDASEYLIKLIVRPADSLDVFNCDATARLNTIYYYKKNDLRVEGPFRVVREQNDLAMEESIFLKKVYVPDRFQTFEVVKTALKKAS